MNYTIQFDESLEALDIYGRYPVLMPFIGIDYPSSEKKVLFVGESHYLPKEMTAEDAVKWYKSKLGDYNFDFESKRYLTTRTIISEDVIDGEKMVPAHVIYRNIGNEFGDVFSLGNFKNSLRSVAFYNYFLRPATTPGESIVIQNWEEEILSFQTLNRIQEILKPDLILFVSKMARQSFHRVRWELIYQKEGARLESIINDVPHPGSIWWNRKSKSFGNLTGKEKFRKILEEMKG